MSKLMDAIEAELLKRYAGMVNPSTDDVRRMVSEVIAKVEEE
jgi:hypothetical protein